MCRFCPTDADGFAVAQPTLAMLEGFKDALRRGWSPNTMLDVSREELAAAEDDPAGFVERHSDRTGANVAGTSITLPDGVKVAKLPGLERWIWDHEGFIGRIGLRYQPGSNVLPPHVLGHIGYAVVPWRRGRGFAKRALAHVLVTARRVGLSEVMITCDADNHASRRVIEANCGRFAEVFVDLRFGAHPRLRYFISLG